MALYTVAMISLMMVRDAAFFVADLPVINEVAGQTELGHKITNYGPKFMELVASYKGRVVFGPYTLSK